MVKNISVYGIYSNRSNLDEAIEGFKQSGFRNTDTAILMPENSGSKDLCCNKQTKAPEGAMAGAALGALIGGALAWMVAAGILLIPEAEPRLIEPLLAAGPILSLLAGLGAGGLLGALPGGLLGWSIPEYVAQRYAGRIRKGGMLLSAHCDNGEWRKKALKILKLTGAEYISSATEAKADYAQTTKPFARLHPQI